MYSPHERLATEASSGTLSVHVDPFFSFFRFFLSPMSEVVRFDIMSNAPFMLIGEE